MVHARAVASICAVLALGGAVLLAPRLFGAPRERISVSASPIRGEYYFVGANVPDTYPVSTESEKGPSDTCQQVAEWARNSGAAPVNNDVDVRIQGPAGADITVLDVLARIEDQRSVAGPIRVRCPELVHDQLEPDYQVDFAQSGTALVRPPRRVPLRATSAVCALPLASCGQASLRVSVRGVERTEYRYYLQITYLVGSEKRASIVGDTSSADSNTRPLRTAIEHDRTGNRYFEWAPKEQNWESATAN